MKQKQEFKKLFIEFKKAKTTREVNKTFEAMYPSIRKVTKQVLNKLDVRDPALREELLQICLIKVWEKMIKKEISSKLVADNYPDVLGYVKKVAFNCILDYFTVNNNYTKHVSYFKLLVVNDRITDGRFYLCDLEGSKYIIEKVKK